MSSRNYLKGLTIIDCSVLLPGPFIGKLLVDEGATVIKVENPKRPDPARELGAGGFYDHLNAEKRLVSIDLTSSEGKEQFRELVQGAHGLIDSFRPSAKKKLGLDESSLHAINPNLSIVSLVGYPEDGAYAERAGHDLNFQAVSGALSLFSSLPGLPLSELMVGYEGALAMTASILGTLRGQSPVRSVLSISESLKKAQGRFVREAELSRELPRFGTTLLTGKYPCYNLYQSSDGRRFAMAAMEEKFWLTVCDLLGLPELANQRFAEGAAGLEAKARIQGVIGGRCASDWLPSFLAHDCCIELVAEYPEVFPGKGLA